MILVRTEPPAKGNRARAVDGQSVLVCPHMLGNPPPRGGNRLESDPVRSARVSAGRGQRFRSMQVAVGVVACALAAGGWAVPSVSGADGGGGRPLAAVNATASPQPDNTSGQSPTSDVVGVPAVRMVPTLAELGPPASGAPTATAQGVSAALLPLLAGPSLPPPMGVVVTEPATGDVLVDLQGETPLTPASTVKLLTAAAALNTFGTEHRLTTTVVAPTSRLRSPGGGWRSVAHQGPAAAVWGRIADPTGCGDRGSVARRRCGSCVAGSG